MSLPYAFHIDRGLRFDSFRRTRRRDQYDPATQERTAAAVEQVFAAHALTYRAGILYAPVEQSSTYFTVSSSFRPNTTLGPDGQNYDPQCGLQLEAGQVFAWGKKLTGHAALFYITKSNVLYALGQDRFDLADEVQSRDGELGIETRPVHWLAAHAGYSYTDAQFIRFQEGDVDLTGMQPRLVADHSASAFITTKPIPDSAISSNSPLLAWTGSIPRWIYPAFLRRQREVWRWIVITIASLACDLSVIGWWLGWRLRQTMSRPVHKPGSRAFAWKRWYARISGFERSLVQLRFPRASSIPSTTLAPHSDGPCARSVCGRYRDARIAATSFEVTFS